MAMNSSKLTHIARGLYRNIASHQRLEVFGVVTHADTLERLVFYRACKCDPAKWQCQYNGEHTDFVQPLEKFVQNVVVDNGFGEKQ
jgi:hypothetical protein